jgi:hypothetical protein
LKLISLHVSLSPFLPIHLHRRIAEMSTSPCRWLVRFLELSQADEERELEFELNYLASLTFEERLKIMRQKSREMLRQMVEHGHRRPFEILKRT